MSAGVGAGDGEGEAEPEVARDGLLPRRFPRSRRLAARLRRSFTLSGWLCQSNGRSSGSGAASADQRLLGREDAHSANAPALLCL